MSSTLSYSNLVNTMVKLPRKHQTLMVAIDGCGASGKSTFSKMLRAACPQITIVQMNDFFRPSAERPSRDIAKTMIGPDFDWEHLRFQVLQPLSENTPGRYQRYDWPTDILAEWHEIPG